MADYEPQPTQPRTPMTQSGWVTFAAIVLFIIGCLNILWGLGAIFQDDVLSRSASGDLIVWDTTAWGWFHLLMGIIILCTGLGLFGNAGWARWTAVFFLGLNALAQIGWMTWYPLWSILIITLDIVVIYHLTARWHPEEA